MGCQGGPHGSVDSLVRHVMIMVNRSHRRCGWEVVMIGSIGFAVVWSSIAVAGAAAIAAVLLTSGPLAPDRSIEQSDVATATVASATGIVEYAEQGRLAEIADTVDTSQWRMADEPSVRIKFLVPPEYHYSVRELPPLLFDDPGVSRYELRISQDPLERRTPLPSHVWPDRNLSLTVIFLPSPIEPIPFGQLESKVLDSVTIPLLGGEISVADREADDFGPRRIVAQANLTIDSGAYHVSGLVNPASDDQLARALIGMLQSLEATSESAL